MSEHSGIAAAFVAAQAEFTHVVATREGQARAAKFTYADLSDLIEMAKPILQRHGLAFQTHNGRAPGGVTAETVFIHVSGESMRTGPTFVGVPDEAGGQAFGSGYTYARRYSLLAALGVAADDDDGAAAMRAQLAKVEKAQALAAAPRLTDEHRTIVGELLARAGHAAPDLGDVLVDDFPRYVRRAIQLNVKAELIDAGDADAVETAAVELDLAKLRKLIKAKAATP